MYEVPDQSGRRIVITGANSGTGKEAARRLGAAGAEVVMAVRTPQKGEEARQEILREYPQARLQVRRLDLASQASVHDFADRLLEDDQGIDVLINNAGVMAPAKRFLTEDEFELQLGTNALGPFALTLRLLPRLLTSRSPRVVMMSSGVAAIGSIRFRDLHYDSGYQRWFAYGQSKLADLLITRRLAEIAATEGWSLLSTAAHPGYTRTNLQITGPNLGRTRQARPAFSRLPAMEVSEGTGPLLFAAVDPGAEQGGYYGPTGVGGMSGPVGPAKFPWAARGVDLAPSLWAVAEDLTGIRLAEQVSLSSASAGRSTI